MVPPEPHDKSRFPSAHAKDAPDDTPTAPTGASLIGLQIVLPQVLSCSDPTNPSLYARPTRKNMEPELPHNDDDPMTMSNVQLSP